MMNFLNKSRSKMNYQKFQIKNINKYNKLDIEFNTLKNNTNNKETSFKKNNIKIIPLPDNLQEIVYYRNMKGVPKYRGIKVVKNNIPYLSCCKEINYSSVLNNDNYITCQKCYMSYKLNNENKLMNIEINEHKIINTKEILKEISCNNECCDYIGKRKIDFCNICIKNRKFNESIFFYKEASIDVLGHEVINEYTKFIYNDIIKYGNLVDIGKKAGYDLHDKNMLLIDYLKKFQKTLFKDNKTQKSIKNKVLRSYALMNIFNDNKYKNIKYIINRIGFDINLMANIDDQTFLDFKNYIISKLDKYALDENIIVENNESLPDNNIKYCGNYGHGCSEYVNKRSYCVDCMEDGYFTSDGESSYSEND